MAGSIQQQAERLYQVFAGLVRDYQYRDREGICCHGLSISQCHALDLLGIEGATTMGALASHLRLEVSTMTRVVDYLVEQQLVTRIADAKDRRVCRVKIARKGRSLMSRIRGELVKEYELVLREVPPESREAVISALSSLHSAFKERCRPSCTADRMATS